MRIWKEKLREGTYTISAQCIYDHSGVVHGQRTVPAVEHRVQAVTDRGTRIQLAPMGATRNRFIMSMLDEEEGDERWSTCS